MISALTGVEVSTVDHWQTFKGNILEAAQQVLGTNRCVYATIVKKTKHCVTLDIPSLSFTYLLSDKVDPRDAYASKNISLGALGAVTRRMQRRTACKIQNG